MTRPDPFDVLEVTLGLDARPVRLPDLTVVRTQGRPDAGPGNAVHRLQPLDPADLDEALADARRRLAHPDTVARVVAPSTPALLAVAGDRADVAASELVVALLDEPVATPAGWPWCDDVLVESPGDDRAWHGITVLHRHAATGGDDVRARGEADDRLAWWVAGQRQMVGLGRARVVRAERFGTPVGTATLVWEPRVDVGGDHAGLAVITDVVVHPAHRRLGVAATMVGALLTAHLAAFPRARVATVADAALADGLVALGWREHARFAVLQAR